MARDATAGDAAAGDAAAGQADAGEAVTPRVAVGAVCVRDGRLLVIERAHDPGAGRWSLPGGRVEAGETLAGALRREVAEETRLDVEVGALCGIAERIGDGYHYVILDFWVLPTPASGSVPAAGDDSSDARWVTHNELTALPLVAGLHEWLGDHGVLALLA